MNLKNEISKTFFSTKIELGTMMVGLRINSTDSEKIILLACDSKILLSDTSVS